MVVFELLSAVLAMSADHLLQTRFGALGVLCLLFVGVGVRARNTACLSTGAVILILLMIQA